jgi:bifunctional UDP-N-acetylglucosamine pyrophosphorylase/glucosamine-1-phosphate N-acetyltransferase
MAEENEVMGINSKKELATAEQIFQNSRRKEFIEKGVTLLDPGSVFFSYDSDIEADVLLESNIVIKNGVKIHSGATIKSFSYLEGCEIESGSMVGPFARVRPGSLLRKNSRVGNFCEIKKSIVGASVKISHLSYIGDTDVGDETNIGAGTITCNYDGYSKFKTKIGKNSFVGSNTIFIAPVEIGDNSLTAAGSVIVSSVRDNSLAIARAEQKTVPDGMIKYREKHEHSPEEN